MAKSQEIKDFVIQVAFFEHLRLSKSILQINSETTFKCKNIKIVTVQSELFRSNYEREIV